MKRLLCVLLVVVMVCGLAGCGDGSGATEPTEEVTAAINVGLVPEELQKNLTKQITYAEFSKMIDQFYDMMYPDSKVDWEEVSAGFRTAEEPMTRSEGMMVFLYAVETVGLETANYEYTFPTEDLFTEKNPGKDYWEGFARDSELLPNMLEIYQNETFLNDERTAWRCELNYMINAGLIAESYSLSNGEPYFNCDENYSFRFGDPFTREEAICAIYRLYGTARFVQYVPTSEIPCLVTKEAIEQGKTMPNAAYNDLPNWCGHTIEIRREVAFCGAGLSYTKSEVDAIAAAGFNFVRVPLNFSHLFEGSDTIRANPAFFATMDDLVNWCAEAGIHVCFDLHDMPGFTTDANDSNDTLFFEETPQKLFAAFWRVMAEHYRDVPSNLLSFNLLNEPHGNHMTELTDEVYSQVMRPAIQAIQDVTPDRLIFVDMLGVTIGTPVEGLANEKVAQTFHPYLVKGEMNWPAVGVNGMAFRGQGEFTLRGNFAAGTDITISLGLAHSVSTLELMADGAVVSTFTIGGEIPGEDGCTELNEQGTGGEWRRYEGKVWTTILEQPCSELRIRQMGDGVWYQLSSVALVGDGAQIDISHNNNLVPKEKPAILTITADGTVTAEDPQTMYALNVGGLRDMFAIYEEFRQRTGQEIMAQEFGCPVEVESSVACRANDDLLKVLAEMDIPWCSWCNDYGVLLLADFVQKEQWEEKSRLRENATYTDNSEGWLIYEEMLEVYQKYMK